VRVVVADFRALAGRHGALRVGEALGVDFAGNARADRLGRHDARRP
jgi:hypothetical protein